jgi:hypothetical protein
MATELLKRACIELPGAIRSTFDNAGLKTLVVRFSRSRVNGPGALLIAVSSTDDPLRKGKEARNPDHPAPLSL